MTTYRDNSLDPAALVTMTVGGQAAFDVAVLCSAVKFSKSWSFEQYSEWVKVWRENYRLLSERSRLLKSRVTAENTQEMQIALHVLSKLANTMLNARQLAKDIRRAVLDAEFAASQAEA